MRDLLGKAQRIPSDFIGLLRMMQSGVNLLKTGKIVGCNIVYVIFLIICNSIINQTKKKILENRTRINLNLKNPENITQIDIQKSIFF